MQATLALALISLPALLMALRESRRGYRLSYVLWKGAASAVFLTAASTVPWDSQFDRLLFVGLVGHAIGDVLIAWPFAQARRMFVFAIGGFLLGHVFYFLAFQATVPELVRLDLRALVVSALINLGIFVLVRERLGRLALPGFVYAVAMTAMSAAGISRGVLADVSGGVLLTAGALLYNASDGAVVRERFVQSSFVNKIWGLPAYYVSQYILICAMYFF